MRIPLWAAALLALACAAPARAQDGEQQSLAAPLPGAGVVLGRVVEASTFAPLQGAQVRIPALRSTVVAGPNGVFTARGIPVGDHTVMVARVGYRTEVQVWRVGAQGLELEVRLQPDAVVLERIVVESRRFDRRLRSAGMSSRGYDADDLAASAQPDARSFLRSRMGLPTTYCSSTQRLDDGPDACVLVRGGPVRPCVIVDERPAFGGMSELELYRPQELFRLDILGGGRIIQAYTYEYVNRMTRRRWQPINADQLTASACRI